MIAGPGVAAPPRTFEDIAAGEIHKAGPVQITREAIIAFATTYAPHPYHLDEAAGANSLLGGLAASGWHTAAIGMRLLYDGFVGAIACMGSPGVDEVRWLKPVRPGDALSLVLHVETVRPSASRPDRGFVGLFMRLRNDSGAVVMTQRFTIMVGRRGAGLAAAAAAPPANIAASTLPDPDTMLTAFTDEVAIGHESVLGTQLFTPEVIVGFASAFDPQAFHLDEAAGRRSHFSGLCASGWQTAAFWMAHYVAARRRSAALRAARGLPVTVGGPSPGFTDMAWLRPLLAGQTIRYGLRVTAKRRAGRSGWSLMSTLNTGHAGDGTLVFSFAGRLLWPMAPR